MDIKSNDSLIKDLDIFSKRCPRAFTLSIALFVISVVIGIAVVTPIHYKQISRDLILALVQGPLVGILAILLPTMLTAIIIKSMRRQIKVKHALLISMIGDSAYIISLVISSIAYVFTGNLSISTLIVLIGDASAFGWWFFVSKVVFGYKKGAAAFAVVQPTLNILLFIPASLMIFSSSTPLSILLIKLYAGIFIFLIVSYMILYLFDIPLKKNLGFKGIDAFSQFVQSWLFEIDIGISNPLGGNTFGKPTDIDVSTIVFRKKDGSLKAIMYAPWIHYGPAGLIGGSDFPYMLERYAVGKYHTTAVVMHSAVNEDYNPVSSTQFPRLVSHLNKGVADAKPIGNGKISFLKSQSGKSKVTLLQFDKVFCVSIFTRAPAVTEDIGYESSVLFRNLLGDKAASQVLIDAHNSRYESANAEELLGVKHGTSYMYEYVNALKKLTKPLYSTRKLRMGVASVDAYSRLESPTDIARGNVNAFVFAFDGFKYATIHFNSNNMLPTVREKLISSVKERYGIEAEMFTTDTHAVNSLEKTASNVLGRDTSVSKLIALVDEVVGKALSNIEPVEVSYAKDTIKRFHVWGPNVRDKLTSVIGSVLDIAKIIVPVIIVAGFVAAAWIISLV
jgi:putative membrane protein